MKIQITTVMSDLIQKRNEGKDDKLQFKYDNLTRKY